MAVLLLAATLLTGTSNGQEIQGTLASGAAVSPEATTEKGLGAFLSGVITDYQSGRPLAYTRVVLSGPPAITQKGQFTTFSDLRGEFRFENLPSGLYRLEASRPHYAVYKHGSQDWTANGAPIVLQPGGAFTAHIRLRRLGVISGKVLDTNDIGLEGHTVAAYRTSQRLELAAVTKTDDRGIYRLTDLEPGRYLVRSSARLVLAGEGFLPVFYPAAASSREAAVVEVGLDQEVGGIDLRPPVGKLAALTGYVIGQLPAKVTLIGDTGAREISVQPSLGGGEFTVQDLAPGQYEVTAVSLERNPLRAARRRITVSEGTQSLSLELKPAPRLRVRCVDESGRELSRGAATVFLSFPNRLEQVQQSLACGEERELVPGVYEVTAVPPSGGYLKSLSGGQYGEVAYEMTVDGPEPVVLTAEIGENAGMIQGLVKTSDGQPAIGAPVYLRPVGKDLAIRVGGLRSARAGGNGEFAFPALAPGRYELVSAFGLESAGERIWTQSRAVTIDLEAGKRAQLEIILVESRE